MNEPLAVRQARMTASKLLYDFDLDGAVGVPVEVLAYEKGMIVGEKEIRGSEGRLVRRGPRSFAAVKASLPREKKRFVTAHELGHHMLHIEAQVKVCDEAAFVVWNQTRPQEWEANVFASEVLMPKRAYRQDMLERPCGFDAVRALASRYNVSRSAAALRYVELDVFPCAIVFARGDRVCWGRVSGRMPWFSLRRDQLDGRSGAAEYLRAGHVTERPELTPVHAWFYDEGARPHDRLYEQCLPMPTLGAVLSLLWTP